MISRPWSEDHEPGAFRKRCASKPLLLLHPPEWNGRRQDRQAFVNLDVEVLLLAEPAHDRVKALAARVLEHGGRRFLHPDPRLLENVGETTDHRAHQTDEDAPARGAHVRIAAGLSGE